MKLYVKSARYGTSNSYPTDSGIRLTHDKVYRIVEDVIDETIYPDYAYLEGLKWYVDLDNVGTRFKRDVEVEIYSEDPQPYITELKIPIVTYIHEFSAKYEFPHDAIYYDSIYDSIRNQFKSDLISYLNKYLMPQSELDNLDNAASEYESIANDCLTEFYNWHSDIFSNIDYEFKIRSTGKYSPAYYIYVTAYFRDRIDSDTFKSIDSYISDSDGKFEWHNVVYGELYPDSYKFKIELLYMNVQNRPSSAVEDQINSDIMMADRFISAVFELVDTPEKMEFDYGWPESVKQLVWDTQAYIKNTYGFDTKVEDKYGGDIIVTVLRDSEHQYGGNEMRFKLCNLNDIDEISEKSLKVPKRNIDKAFRYRANRYGDE